MERCKRCGEFYFDFEAGCSCRLHYVAVEEWDVATDWNKGLRVPGTDRLEFHEQWAKGAVDAARALVESRDGDHDVIEDPVHVVVVSGSGADRRILRFAVRAAVVIEYWAAPTDTDPPAFVPDARKLSASALERWGVPV